jgi:hypothetical protein
MSQRCHKPTSILARLRFASIAGLNINPLADKLLYDFESLPAVIRAEPNSWLTGIGRLPATAIAHLAFGEMCSGTLTVRIAIDEVLDHPELSKSKPLQACRMIETSAMGQKAPSARLI